MADGQEVETTRDTKEFSIIFITYSRHLNVTDRMEGVKRTVRTSAMGGAGVPCCSSFSLYFARPTTSRAARSLHAVVKLLRIWILVFCSKIWAGTQVGFKGERRPPEGCLNKKGPECLPPPQYYSNQGTSVDTARPEGVVIMLCIFFPFTTEDMRKGSPVDRNSFHNNMIGAAGKSFLFSKHKRNT